MASIPGLLFSLTKPMDPNIPEAQFNDWYTNKHLVDTVNFGLASLAVRFKNVNPSHQWPYLALYRLQDLAKLYDMEFMSSLPTDSPAGWGVPNSKADIRIEPRGYQLLTTMERENANTGVPKFVLTVEFRESTMNAEAFVASCQSLQFDDVGKQRGYRRSMLYQAGRSLVPQEGKAGTEFRSAEQQQPAYLVVHEFDQMPAHTFQEEGASGLWEYMAEYGTGLYRTEPVPVKVYN
ncbi:Atr1 [Stachybotrys chartarum IBT 40288]|nr:Atr1 [Stachybotrys chartarum IBT 40288]